MLGYLEQMPLYNAANFSWAVGMGPGLAINSTVSISILNVFICPSDGLSPVRPIRLQVCLAGSGPARPTTTSPPWARRQIMAAQRVLSHPTPPGSSPRAAILRRPELHRRDLQYDRVRGITGRRPHNRGREVAGWSGARDGHLPGAGSSTTSALPLKAVMADLQTCSDGLQNNS